MCEQVRFTGRGEIRPMRHRFHSICPYFAMFPETFVAEHLAASRYDGAVFDPFCGRGTTVFESLIQGRLASGRDVGPGAARVSGAKSEPLGIVDVLIRLDELEELCSEDRQAAALATSGEPRKRNPQLGKLRFGTVYPAFPLPANGAAGED